MDADTKGRGAAGKCSNPRCARPKPDEKGRCLGCQALLTDVLVRHRYKIEQTIGRGGFGTTYLVRDHDLLDEPRILKELHPQQDDLTEKNFNNTAERLFKREALVLLTLQHPGIPKLHAYFNENNYSYLVQDYIPGNNLAEEVTNRRHNLDEQEARILLAEIAEILEYLHTYEPPIVHRDIKPQNLMRHSSGDYY